MKAMERHIDFRTAALFAHDGVNIIVLSRGRTISGKPFYAFVKIKPSRYGAFQAAEASGEAYRVQDFGEIIRFGYEETPSEAVLSDVRMAYENPPPSVSAMQPISL